MHYTKKFKEKVLKRYYETGAISETARKFKIPVSTLGTWIKVDKVSRGIDDRVEDEPPTPVNTPPINEVNIPPVNKDFIIGEGLSVADFDVIIAKRENELKVLKEARRILLEELGDTINPL